LILGARGAAKDVDGYQLVAASMNMSSSAVIFILSGSVVQLQDEPDYEPVFAVVAFTARV
jgi:hypothetical protein